MMKAKRKPQTVIMAMSKEQRMEAKQKDTSLWVKQMAEFNAFLDEKTLGAHNDGKQIFPFFMDMRVRLIDQGCLLTEKQCEALRKCMKREEEWKAQAKNKKEGKPLKNITLKIKPFLMKEMKLDSRVITGAVKAESAKAWLIEGKADMLENASWCVRCGRELSEPASQITGMGSTCASKAGVPYDSEGVLHMAKRQRTAIRKQFQTKLNAQTFERWIPKSQAEVLEEKPSK